MTRISRAFGGVAFVLLALRWCEGTIQCLCSTRDCQENSDILCNTDSLCYVQYTPLGTGTDPDTPEVVRGCIDGKTPLLCENQRPSVYSGPWPILHCCDRDLCNKDAVPTLPPWASQVPSLPPWASHKQESRHHQNAYETDTVSPGDTDIIITKHYPGSDRSAALMKELPGKEQSNSLLINPLYIGVPIAGACVLLAIIIFAIYILRKQHEMYAEHFQNDQSVKRWPPYLQDGPRYPTIQTASGQYSTRCQNGCPYNTACDSSSNGSESRLLSQV